MAIITLPLLTAPMSATPAWGQATLSGPLARISWPLQASNCEAATDPWRAALLVAHVSLSCIAWNQSWGTLSWEAAPELGYRPRARGFDHLAPGLGLGLAARIPGSRSWRWELRVLNKATLGPGVQTQDEISVPGFHPQLFQAWLDVLDTGIRLEGERAFASLPTWSLTLKAGETLPPVLRLTALGSASRYLAMRWLVLGLRRKGENLSFETGMGYAVLDYERLRAIFPFPWASVSYRFEARPATPP